MPETPGASDPMTPGASGPPSEGSEARTAFVIGHPVAQSRSPLIHRHWLAEHGLPGDYRAVGVAPGALKAWLAALDPALTTGGNVTVPHKESVHAWLGPDRLDAAARAVGAVNTLWFEDGILRGGNTDGLGLTADLDARAPGWRETRRAVVIGAGGASRAVVHALNGAGLEVSVANRTRARGEGLAEEFGLARGTGLDDLPALLEGAGLIVNTASLGMIGTEGSSERPAHLDPRRLPAGAIAYDIVYAPLVTPFLAAAREAGCRAVDGLGMLLHQAVPGFERWFGVRPAVTDELRAAIEATL